MHELLREYVQGFQLPGLKDHVLVKLEIQALGLLLQHYSTSNKETPGG
jgi:hypothetical protein